MHIRRYLSLATVLAFPTSAFSAQPPESVNVNEARPASPSAERRLTPSEIDRILDAAAARREAAEEAALDAGPKVFGEVGFAIGTGGYRSAFGSATVPLDDGFASFTFSTDRVNDQFDSRDR